MITIIEKVHQIIFGVKDVPPQEAEPLLTEVVWVGLTEAELRSCLPIAKLTDKPGVWFTTAHAMTALRAAEAKLKEKNR